MGERLPRFDVTIESEKDRPHHISETAIGYNHVADGLCLDLLPDADSLEQALRRGNNGGRAPIICGACQRRVGNANAERRPKTLAQRDRQRQAGKARPTNEYIHALRALR